MAAVVARGALRGLAAAPLGRSARPQGAAAAFIVRRGASMGLAAARPPPASQRCARATHRALSTAAPASQTKPEDDGYAWVPYAVLAAIGGLGFWFWRASTAHGNRSALIDLIEDEQPRLMRLHLQRAPVHQVAVLELSVQIPVAGPTEGDVVHFRESVRPQT